MSLRRCPALFTISTPRVTWLPLLPIRLLISFEAWPERSGQCPDFGRHHGKAAARIAGPCRLDRGVQGEQIGLEGDLFDQADDIGDPAGGMLDLAHGRDGSLATLPPLSAAAERAAAS